MHGNAPSRLTVNAKAPLGFPAASRLACKATFWGSTCNVAQRSTGYESKEQLFWRLKKCIIWEDVS